MTISLPGSKKRGLSGLLGRKKTQTNTTAAAQKQLAGEQIAKLFNKAAREEKSFRPAKLSAVEKEERNEMSTLRGALYSKK